MTHRERELLDFVERYMTLHGGVSPSWDEMRVALGLSSKSGVSRLVESLVAQRKLRREHTGYRSIVVIDHDPFVGIATDRLVAELRRRGITIAACGECDAVPGSPKAAACTRTDCGLADRFHARSDAA
jgi:repressor LexA